MGEYLKKLTFLTPEEIMELEQQQAEAPHLRPAQKALAAEVVRDLHGQEALDTALAITEALFRGKLQELTPKQRHQAVAPMEKWRLLQISPGRCAGADRYCQVKA